MYDGTPYRTLTRVEDDDDDKYIYNVMYICMYVWMDEWMNEWWIFGAATFHVKITYILILYIFKDIKKMIV